MLINTKQSEILLSLFARVLSCPLSPVYMWKSFLVCLSDAHHPSLHLSSLMPSLITECQGHSEAISQHEKNLMTRCSLLLLGTNDSLGFEWVVTAELSLHGQRRPFFLEPLLSALLCRLVFIWSCYKKYKRIYWNHSVLISDLLDKNALLVWKWVAVNVFFFIYYSLQWQSLIFVSQCAV